MSRLLKTGHSRTKAATNLQEIFARTQNSHILETSTLSSVLGRNKQLRAKCRQKRKKIVVYFNDRLRFLTSAFRHSVNSDTSLLSYVLFTDLKLMNTSNTSSCHSHTMGHFIFPLKLSFKLGFRPKFGLKPN